MGLGDDIKSVLQELGTPITVYKLGQSPITGEYVDPESYPEHSTEFIRQNCFTGDFQYDSVVEEGDLLSFDNKWFLMLNVKRTLFEGNNVINSTFFVECNVNGAFAKENELRDPTTKKLKSVWFVTEKNSVRALMVNKSLQIEDFSGSENVVTKLTLFCQNYTNIFVGDRWYPDVNNTKEYYRISKIDKHRYENIFVCDLIEDSRE